jgi:hypothetical protein
MEIKYLFSSPEGDISLRSADLARPFLITPSEHHPFLTLGDYFEAIKAFILKDQGKRLVHIFKESLHREIGLDSIHKILIRSEKHGRLYHVASVDIFMYERPIKFAVTTAVSEKARACLTNEYEMLKSLNRSLRLPYLPEVHKKGDVKCQDGRNHHETLTLILSEWFEDYHEWHLSIDEKDNRQKVCIWDLEKGHRYVSEKETFEIFRQVSKILTLYYDAHTFKQIYPWHHAAGDFVVKTWDDGIHVKLTTVRDYQSIMEFFSEDAAHPMIAIVYFFLNLTIRIRLDKLDGVGETAWAGDFSVHAATQGFIEALRIMDGEGMFEPGHVQDLFSLLQSLDQDEVERLLQPLLDLYQKDGPADLPVIQTNLKNHVSFLCRALQDSRL